ncbi:MAG: hypothetical protein O2807_04745 [bacterium]|nr:hypothetical protein [bacterium]
MAHPPDENEEISEPALPTIVTSHFKLIFITVSAITIVLLLVSISIDIFASAPSPRLMKVADRTWQLFVGGFGTMLGLIGGKSL